MNLAEFSKERLWLKKVCFANDDDDDDDDDDHIVRSFLISSFLIWPNLLQLLIVPNIIRLLVIFCVSCLTVQVFTSIHQI
jgi:hypothetical protein